MMSMTTPFRRQLGFKTYKLVPKTKAGRGMRLSKYRSCTGICVNLVNLNVLCATLVYIFKAYQYLKTIDTDIGIHAKG